MVVIIIGAVIFIAIAIGGAIVAIREDRDTGLHN